MQHAAPASFGASDGAEPVQLAGDGQSLAGGCSEGRVRGIHPARIKAFTTHGDSLGFPAQVAFGDNLGRGGGPAPFAAGLDCG
jgi:hypothetical protein